MRHAALALGLVLLATAPALPAEKAPDKKEAPAARPAVVATLGDIAVTEAELEQRVRTQLAQVRAQEYAIKERALREMLDERLVEKEAASRKLALPDLLQAEIEAKLSPVPPEEVASTYERYKSRLPGKSEAEGKAFIEDGLKQQRRFARREEFLKELRARDGARARILLEPPRVAVDPSDDPFKGPKDAPVTIVEFSDFQCPYCARVGPTLKELEKRYGDKLRLVFRDFPLPIHPQAPKAAEAASCAAEQGKFWEMHDALFANQKALDVAALKQRASEIGLTAEAFAACLDSGKYADEWKADMDAAQSYGVNSTPAFFINGRLVSGAKPLDEFVAVIDDELERAAARTAKP
jgi:protein-disulfide isomerase